LTASGVVISCDDSGEFVPRGRENRGQVDTEYTVTGTLGVSHIVLSLYLKHV